MIDTVFDRLLVPVADAEDAYATANALGPYAAGISELVVLHVRVADDAPDGTAADDEQTDSMFESFHDAFGDSEESIAVRTELRRGTDAMAAIADATEEFDVTGVGVLPRPRNILLRLVSETQTTTLIKGTDVPVVVFPADSRRDGSPVAWPPAFLVGLDGSEQSFDALELVCAGFPAATIVAVHVFDDPATDVYTTLTPGLSTTDEQASRDECRELDAIRERATSIADRHGVELDAVTLGGDVASAILAAAEEKDVDVIVIKSRDSAEQNGDENDGEDAFDITSGQRLLDDVSKRLISDSPVAVLIV